MSEGAGRGANGWWNRLVVPGFDVAPEPVTPLQRKTIWVLAILVALTRVWAMSRTLWDWDEALFVLALREYDVTSHRPHPPGFPVYVAMAKMVRFFMEDDFRALQRVNVFFASLLFPAAVMLGREVRLRNSAAIAGALLLVFVPHVWFFGGTAFSDVPALTVVLFACALLFRGIRDRSAWYAGVVLVGLAGGMRPQVMLVAGAIPMLLATIARGREKLRDAVAGIVIPLTIVAVSYGAAVAASGSLAGYRLALGQHAEYARSVDSYVAEGRPPIRDLVPQFLIVPRKADDRSIMLIALGLLGLLGGRWRSSLIVFLMFMPMALGALFFLDLNSVSRYSISYTPAYAILSGAGIMNLARWSSRWKWVWRSLVGILTLTATLTLAWWSVPPLELVRTTTSPPVQAMRWIERELPSDAQLIVHGSVLPHAQAMLTRPFETYGWLEKVPFEQLDERSWLVTEGSFQTPGGRWFVRRPYRLRRITRERYFAASVFPLLGVPQYGAGWYLQEGDRPGDWRWMGAKATVRFVRPSRGGRITVDLEVPKELVSRGVVVTIECEGERTTITPKESLISWTQEIAPANRAIEVDIMTSRVINPAKEGILPDGRDLGLRLSAVKVVPNR